MIFLMFSLQFRELDVVAVTFSYNSAKESIKGSETDFIRIQKFLGM